jgi:hypothetical protein
MRNGNIALSQSLTAFDPQETFNRIEILQCSKPSADVLSFNRHRQRRTDSEHAEVCRNDLPAAPWQVAQR